MSFVQVVVLIVIALTVVSFKVYFSSKYEAGDEIPLFPWAYIALCLMETVCFITLANTIIGLEHDSKFVLALFVAFGICDIKGWFRLRKVRYENLEWRSLMVEPERIKTNNPFF